MGTQLEDTDFSSPWLGVLQTPRHTEQKDIQERQGGGAGELQRFSRKLAYEVILAEGPVISEPFSAEIPVNRKNTGNSRCLSRLKLVQPSKNTGFTG
jgi:hypothetical protein